MTRYIPIFCALLLAGCSVPTAVVTTPAVGTMVSADALVPKVSSLTAHLPVMTVLWTNGNCRCYSNLITGLLFTNCNCCTPPMTNVVIAGVIIPTSQPMQFFRTSDGWLQATANFHVWTNLSKCSGSVTLGWNASAEPTVTSYNVYWGGSDGIPTNEAGGFTGTSGTITGLQPGVTYEFWATCQTLRGMESAFSIPAFATVPFKITKG